MNHRAYSRCLLGLAAMLSVFAVEAAGLSLSTQPLYVTQPLPPNIIITPVYNSEYNEVSLREAPWSLYYNGDCVAGGEKPCRKADSNIWDVGPPYMTQRVSDFAWRVVPWPEVFRVKRTESEFENQLNSNVSLYPRDTQTRNGQTRFAPLDYRSDAPRDAGTGPRGSSVTEEQYPESGKLNLGLKGRSLYARSNLNFLYYDPSVTYPVWPSMAGYTFSDYSVATADRPKYHPITRSDVTANLSGISNYLSRVCDAKDNSGNPYYRPLACSAGSVSSVSASLGQYWVYDGTGPVWASASYDGGRKTWSGMTDPDRVNFARWFTYWRSSDLAGRGMLANLINELGPNKRDLLGKLRLGITNMDKAGASVNIGLVTGADSTAVLNGLARIVYDQNKTFTKIDSVLTDTGWPATSTIWEPNNTLKYFQTEAPYRDDPGNAASAVRSCRRNYEIVLTPDYLGLRHDLSPNAPTNAVPGNHDFSLGAPYADSLENTFGDVGAYGWKTDLMPSLQNNLVKSRTDEQTAQHLVRYVIGPTAYGRVFNKSFFDKYRVGNALMLGYDDALKHLNANPASGWANPYSGDLSVLAESTYDRLWQMALNSRGFFYHGNDISQTTTNLLNSINDILVNNVSGAAVATNTTSLSTGGLIYQATVESDWKGHFRAYPVVEKVNASNTKYLAVDYANPVWDLAENVSSAGAVNRKIFSYKLDAGAKGPVPFQWDSIGKDAQDVFKGAFATGTPATKGESLLKYLRGDIGCEAGVMSDCPKAGTDYSFRRRSIESGNASPYNEIVGAGETLNLNGHNVLGDIANSSPWLVTPPLIGISDVDQPGYNYHRKQNKDRKPVLFVGANDGMLHAVLAEDNNGDKAGKELFAYIPSFVLPNLPALADPAYAHQYYVDGSPFSAEADLVGDGSGWKTVLAGGVNRGGRGYYLLDVTNVTGLSEDAASASRLVRWEFTSSDDADLHYTYNMPSAFPEGHPRRGQARQIVRMNDGKWALVVGNGYPDQLAGQRACLFVLYLSGPDSTSKAWTHGTHYRKLCAGATTYAASGGLDTNGLSTPTPYDLDGDGKVDVVYAGDLNGNLWRFDVTGEPATWQASYGGTPVFVAKNADGARQSIIAPPQVTTHASGTKNGLLVLFGTGRLLEDADLANNATQSFYGVWDRGGGLVGATAASSFAGFERGNLMQQSFTFGSAFGQTLRVQDSKNKVAYCEAETRDACDAGQYLGWYWDMLGDVGAPSDKLGERMTGLSNLLNGVVFFNTFYPGLETYTDAGGTVRKRLDPCQYGGSGWVMGLNAVHGYMETDFAVFDANMDGVVDAQDAKAGGVKVGAAIGGTTFARGLGDSRIGIYSPTGKDTTGRASTISVNVGGSGSSRVSWYELMD